MQLLVLVSVVLGVAYATPFLPREDANVAAARANFIQEYNRLAALAAAAPDINIIMDDRTHPSVVNNRHQQQQHNHHIPVFHQQQQHNPQVTVFHQQKQQNPKVSVVRQQQQPRPVSEDPPANIAAARTIFIQEYNRLAALAAAAPDTHIIMSNRNHPNVVNSRHQQQQHNHQVPVVRQQPQSRPVSLRQPANPAFNQYSFSTTLGDNQQFFPQSNFIHNNAHNAGGNLGGHIAAAPTPIFNEPTTRWTGPFSHTLPAGVNGLPRQVVDTPEVAAAKADHFRRHALARANNPVL